MHLPRRGQFEFLLGQLVPVRPFASRLDLRDDERSDGPRDLLCTDGTDLDKMPNDAVAPIGVDDLLDQFSRRGDADRPLGFDFFLVFLVVRVPFPIAVLVSISVRPVLGSGALAAQISPLGRRRGEYARDDKLEIPGAAVARRVGARDPGPGGNVGQRRGKDVRETLNRAQYTISARPL